MSEQSRTLSKKTMLRLHHGEYAIVSAVPQNFLAAPSNTHTHTHTARQLTNSGCADLRRNTVSALLACAAHPSSPFCAGSSCVSPKEAWLIPWDAGFKRSGRAVSGLMVRCAFKNCGMGRMKDFRCHLLGEIVSGLCMSNGPDRPAVRGSSGCSSL